MNAKKIISTMAIAFALALSSCSETEDIVSGNTNTNQNFRVVSVQGRLDVSQARGSNAVVSFRKHNVAPDANGNFVINDTVYRSNAAARQFTSDSISDTVRIVIGKDTLREIPVNSWANILPTNYIVQRNISAVVDAKYASKTVEALWWNADSIAHVVTLGQGTTATNYSGYIYNVYDDSAYGVNAHLYFLLARIRSGSGLTDSVLAYTDVMDVKAKAGDLSYISNQFREDYSFFRLGYPRTPVDSSLKVFDARYTYKADTVLMDAKSTNNLVSQMNGSAKINNSDVVITLYKFTKIVMEIPYDTRSVEDTLTFVAYSFINQGDGLIVKDTVHAIRPVGSNKYVHVFELKANHKSVSIADIKGLGTIRDFPTKSYLVR